MYTTNRDTNRKKVKIIRKPKNTQLEDKHKDDEELELEKQYIENDNEDNLNNNPSTNNNICPSFVINIIKKTWTASYGEKIYGEFPASICKDIKPPKDRPYVIVSCCGYIKECDKKELEKKKKDKENKNESKIALEIEKVKKNQKQKKMEGE